MDFKESYYYYVIKMLLTVLHTKIGHINIWLYYVCVSFRIFHTRGGFLPRHDEDLREPLVRAPGKSGLHARISPGNLDSSL